MAGAGFESNESLGLLLRSQVGIAVGPRLVNNNRAQLFIAGGLAGNDERNVDADPTQNLEGLVTSGSPTTGTIARRRTSTSVSSTTRASVTGAASASSWMSAPSVRS